MKTVNIGIIRSRVIGFATGMGFRYLEKNVCFFDFDMNRVKSLEKQGFQTTTDLKFVTKNSEIFFKCIPTLVLFDAN